MKKKYVWNFALWASGRDFRKEYHQLKLVNSPDTYLRKLLLHAYHNVPYYTEILEETGIVKNDEVDLSRFCEMPILTKEIIREQQEHLVSRDNKNRRRYYNSSGGSTGEPIRFIQDDSYARWGNAALVFWYKNMLGIDEPEVMKVILWGSERDLFQGGVGWKKKMAHWLTNTVFLNSFRMTEDDMVRYIERINSYKPDLIRGYAGSLYELCRYAETKGVKVYAPKAVVSSAEMLTDEMREKIEMVFCTKVYDYYGSRETNNIAGECREGFMHILNFHNYVEVLNSDNQPVKEGEEGRVIVTNLHNYSMPFIRYDIGDMAVPGLEECKCGSHLPTLGKITGRVTERFIREDGAIMSGAALTLTFNLMEWVKEFQIIQEAYKKVRIVIVLKGSENESDKKGIEDKMKILLGEDCQIIWEFVSEIPRIQSGKYLYIRCLVQS
ncbi:phenylacetate--CoA ligase family protein [Chloroflexota bacterium]